MQPIRAIRAHTTDNIGLARDVLATCIVAVPYLDPLPRREAAHLCWSFVKYHTRYFAEMGAQWVRFPWRLVEDGVGDCKSQAIFIGSICAASGCDVGLRYVVLPGDTHFGHVYAIVDGIACDPLLEFGEECSYIASETIPIPHG